VLTQPDDEAESMRGPLYIPDTAKEKPTQGKVLAVEKAALPMPGGGMGGMY
jgi:co-chaperonin GroES (HSP10)